MNLRQLTPPSRPVLTSDDWARFLAVWGERHLGRPCSAKQLLIIVEELGFFRRFLRESRGRHRAGRLALLLREACLSEVDSSICCRQRAGYSAAFWLRGLPDDSPVPVVGFQKQQRPELPPVICACGCGLTLPPSRGTGPRRFIRGHNRRGA